MKNEFFRITALFVNYPQSARERNRWVVSQRSSRNESTPAGKEARNSLRQEVPHAFLRERELAADGSLAECVAVFLTNRECPWKCFMCDLWKNTLETTVAAGMIPRQIAYAFQQMGAPPSADGRSAMLVKLYNSGSFFDPRAVPEEDYGRIAQLLAGFRRVIVECHPLLLGDSCLRFRDLLAAELEVALGLETAHPAALDQLNKGFGVEDFLRKCDWIRKNGMAIRVFLLVNAPFVPLAEQAEWMEKSIQLATDAGAEVICLIPTRPGNGAVEVLIQSGLYSRTTLEQLENALDVGIRSSRARVFADLWDLEQFRSCPHCFSERRFRLQRMNDQQRLLNRIHCGQCR